MFINKVHLHGNLTKDPEVKVFENGSSICTATVATNRKWTDTSGEKKEEVEFHNIVAFGKLAEIIGRYPKKGDGLYVEGRLRTRSWDSPSGERRYRTEIVAESVQFGARSKNNQEQSDSTPPTPLATPPTEERVDPKDIPF